MLIMFFKNFLLIWPYLRCSVLKMTDYYNNICMHIFIYTYIFCVYVFIISHLSERCRYFPLSPVTIYSQVHFQGELWKEVGKN